MKTIVALLLTGLFSITCGAQTYDTHTLTNADSTVLGLSFVRNGRTVTLTGTSVPYAQAAGIAYQSVGLANVAYTGQYSALLNAPTALPAAGGTAATISGTLPLSKIAGALAASGGTATGITLNGFTVGGTAFGTMVRSGTTSGGVYASPTITTPSGLVATDIGGTAATVGSNNAFLGTNNTAPNQVGQTPGSSTMLVKAQADALYTGSANTYILRLANSLSATSTTMVSSTESVVLPAGTYMYDGYAVASTSSTASGITIGCTGSFPTGFGIVRKYTPALTWSNIAPTVSFMIYPITGSADAPSTSTATETHGWCTISTSTTVAFQVSQRNATDAINAVSVAASSSIIFRKIQ